MSCLRRLLGFAILLASLGLLAWGLWPNAVTQISAGFAPGQLQLPQGNTPSRPGENTPQTLSGQTAAPGVPESRTVSLEHPAQLREGDSDIVILTLEATATGVQATAQFGDHNSQSETVEIPNVYNTHSVQAEAALDLPGLNPTSSGSNAQVLLPGRKVSFTWTVKADGVGDYRGAVHLTLRFIPLAGGDESELSIYSQPLQVSVVNLLGIGGQPARWMGLIGALLGSVISAQDVVEFIFGRRGKNKRKK